MTVILHMGILRMGIRSMLGEMHDSHPRVREPGQLGGGDSASKERWAVKSTA